MDASLLIQDLNRAYDLQLTEVAAMEALEDLLTEKVDDLIRTDFNMLVQLLYRIDVSEELVRRRLKESGGADAGRIIARLIIQRQWQKIESRKPDGRPGQRGANGPDGERR
jgi:hypothetical protein